MLTVLMTVLVFNNAGVKVEEMNFNSDVPSFQSCGRIASSSQKQLNEIFKSRKYTVKVECKEI